MTLFDKIYDLVSGIKFSQVPLSFTSKDKLFQLTFDGGWVYSRKGNSFYSFHNMKDDLKGGLQVSLTWNVSPPESMNEEEALIHFIHSNENGSIDFKSVTIADYNAIHYSREYTDSNMTFFYWYIYKEKILIVVTFMILKDEPGKVKNKWLKRITEIINSLKLDIAKFGMTPMK